MENKKQPEIRFSNFDGEWKNESWADVVDISTNMVDPKTGNFDELPHVGPGNIESFTGRILNNVKSVKEDNLISGKFRFKAGDIIYGKINPQLAKYALPSFDGLSSADTYVLNTKNGLAQRFLYMVLQGKDFYRYSVSVSRRTGMPKINRDELNQYTFFMPISEEQRKIGSFFEDLESAITLHHQELATLKQTKEGFLQKMFPKEGELVPEIRFPGFNEAWEQRNLNNILRERKVKQKISEEAPLLAFAAGQGVIDRKDRKTNNRDFLTKDSTTKKYLLTKFDDIVYNPANVKYGAIDRNKHGQGVISPIYVTFETDEFPAFIELIVKSENFKQRALQYEEGTVTKRQSVKPENLLSLNIILPKSKNEQIQIGNFFMQLDELITLHQQELEALKQTKKAFLQKMFV